jgi:hypothetical protein
MGTAGSQVATDIEGVVGGWVTTMLLITTRKCGTDARRSSVLAVARSFVNLALLAGCGDAGAWPGNPQGVST